MTRQFSPKHVKKKTPIRSPLFAGRDLVRTRSRELQKLPRTRSNSSKYPKHLYLNRITAELRAEIDSKIQNVINQKLQEIEANRTSPIINVLARKSINKYAIISDSKLLTKKLYQEMLKHDPRACMATRISDLRPCTPGSNGKKRAIGPKGTPYEEAVAFNNKGVLFKNASPATAQNSDIEFSQNIDVTLRDKFFESKKTDKSFSFTVTREGIKRRRNKRRSVSQKAAFGGYSATQVFRALGAKIDNKISRYFHLAHREGWGLGGPQVKNNLDPATAGSNYTTLFYVEDVIRFLLADKNVPEVKVHGEIEYHPIHTSLPETITYTWSWGEQCSMSKSISALSKRRPTLQENQQARALANAIHMAELNKSQDMELNEDDSVFLIKGPNLGSLDTSQVMAEQEEEADDDIKEDHPLLTQAYDVPFSPMVKQRPKKGEGDDDNASLMNGSDINRYSLFSPQSKKEKRPATQANLMDQEQNALTKIKTKK